MSKVILVTGANSGIGFELVRLLAERGHTVYIGARNIDAGIKARDKLASEGFKNVRFVQVDVNSESSVQAACDTIQKSEGKLNVLVNNAGINGPTEDSDVSVSTIKETMETNFLGTCRTIDIFLPLLRKGASPTSPPTILNVSSELASITYQLKAEPFFWHAPYSASKVAVNSYTIYLAKKLEGEGFKINVVTPGYTSTKLTNYQGPKTMRDGALSLLPWVVLGTDAPTGHFFSDKGGEFTW